MATNNQYDFSVDKAQHTITVRRAFAAPVADVWAAWTEKDLLDQWWAPKPWQSKTKQMDFREGGRRLYAMQGPDGEEHWSFQDFTTISPNSHFAFADGFSDSDGHADKAMPGSAWEVRFEEKGASTQVTVVIKHRSASDIDQLLDMGFKEGFKMALENLDELLAAQKA